MKRRTFAALLATLPLAGCTDTVDEYLGDDAPVMDDELDEDDDPMFFQASEGDEFDVYLEAGDDGAQVSVTPLDAPGWGWQVEENEEKEDTFEIEESGEHRIYVARGSASILIE